MDALNDFLEILEELRFDLMKFLFCLLALEESFHRYINDLPHLIHPRGHRLLK